MASRTVNKVILLGRLGKDADTKFTPSGVAKTTFSIATTRRWKDQQSGDWKEESDWHNIVVWRADALSEYLLKGKQVYIEGRLLTRKYDKDGEMKYVTEVVAEEVILTSSGNHQAAANPDQPVSMPRSARAAQQEQPKGDDFGITDDEIPF